MAATRREPPTPAPSARVIVPAEMVYHGELPLPEPEPSTGLSESVWRNVALTLATVLAIAVGGAVIFWPKGQGGGSGEVARSASAPGASATSTTPAVAMPTGDLPGWHQTFAEDFTSTNLGSRWYIYQGQPGGDPGGYFLPSHVSQRGGKLVINGSEASTPNGNIYATGGISNSKVFTQTYGRFELRFRMDRGFGIAYAIMLWPTSDVWPPEIDIAEDNGDARQTMYTFLHAVAKVPLESRTVDGDFSVWHTVRLDWSPGKLVYLLDGKQWATIATPHVPDIPMSIAIQSQASKCGETWEKCPNSSTPPNVNLEVDWVVAYTKTG